MNEEQKELARRKCEASTWVGLLFLFGSLFLGPWGCFSMTGWLRVSIIMVSVAMFVFSFLVIWARQSGDLRSTNCPIPQIPNSPPREEECRMRDWTKEDFWRFHERTKFCRCGRVGDAYGILREYIQLIADRSADDWKGERAVLANAYTDDPRGLFVAYVADAFGLAEHGGSVFGAWPSNDGYAFLKACEQFGMEPEDLG